MNEIREYLQDLQKELDDIVTFTAGGREVFMMDRMIQKAVIRSYEVIGEIVKRMPQTFRDAHHQIDWRKLAGFRDFLAHNYDVVILANVWIAVEDLPNLKAAIEVLSSEADGNSKSDSN